MMTADDALAVSTHRLSKRYGRASALVDVDLRVPAGAVYVLAGANGAGKSTTINILMNLERPTEGHAQVFGLDSGSAHARAHIGFMPERHALRYGWLTGAQLIRHVSCYYPSWDETYAATLARALDLRLDRKVRTLSKGEGRRLQLLLTLAHRPPLLLLDEPTDGLDPMIRNRVLALLAEHLADSPTTLLVSTHQIHELESLADEVGVLRNGRLVAQLSTDDLRRTVRRYRIEAPAGWAVPSELRPSALRRASTGRELECTLIGEEQPVVTRVNAAGAQVQEVTALPLEDAAIALLSSEVPA